MAHLKQFNTAISLYITLKWKMRLFKRNQRVLLLLQSFPTPICQCWGIWHWLLTWLGSTLNLGKGSFFKKGHFSRKSGNMYQQFFHDWKGKRIFCQLCVLLPFLVIQSVAIKVQKVFTFFFPEKDAWKLIRDYNNLIDINYISQDFCSFG